MGSSQMQRHQCLTSRLATAFFLSTGLEYPSSIDSSSAGVLRVANENKRGEYLWLKPTHGLARASCLSQDAFFPRSSASFSQNCSIEPFL